MLAKLWDFLVRFRTWLVNAGFVLLMFIPDILNQPEVLAVIPDAYDKYIIAAAFLVNIWLRPRPADRKRDLE